VITDLHFHDLRHEAGSRLLEQGWSLHDVNDMLGHADIKTTDTYLNSTTQRLHDKMRRHGTGGQPLHDVAQAVESENPPAVQQPEPAAANVTIN
jgi:hypothetical protein